MNYGVGHPPRPIEQRLENQYLEADDGMRKEAADTIRSLRKQVEEQAQKLRDYANKERIAASSRWPFGKTA